MYKLNVKITEDPLNESFSIYNKTIENLEMNVKAKWILSQIEEEE